MVPGVSYPSGSIDELSFTLKPGTNQLQRVADNAPAEFAPRSFKPVAGAQNLDYSYDRVGNQITDPHKGITVTYNYLNLPSVILWSNGNKMEMTYDAMGVKLSKKVSVGATEQYTQHYLGGIEYQALGTTRKLEAIYFADGRVYNTNVTTASTTVALRYEYAIRDHLGNTRLMFADLDGSGTVSSSEILQENHYYPFGLNMEGPWMNDPAAKKNLYQFNQIERCFEFELGIDLAFYRSYNASIARWLQNDPKPKYSESMFTGFGNNPIKFIDFLGDSIILDLKGYIIRRNDQDGKEEVYLMHKQGGKVTFIGQIGGKINIDLFYDNLLRSNIEEAKKLYNPLTFLLFVKTKGKWDLKNKMKSIFGLGNDGKTKFIYHNEELESQDIGNQHFGAVAKATSFFSEEFILRQAGAYQIRSGTSAPEWQSNYHYETKRIHVNSPTTYQEFVMDPPYGDDPRDQYWIKRGFIYFDKNN